jgi:hypothetical protein
LSAQSIYPTPQRHHDGERWCVWLVEAEGEGEMRKLLLSVPIACLLVGSANAGTDTNWPNRWVKIATFGIYAYYYDNYDNARKTPSSKSPNGDREIRILIEIPLSDGEARQVYDGVPA